MQGVKMTNDQIERLLKTLEKIEDHLFDITSILMEFQIVQRQSIHVKKCTHLDDSMQSYLLTRLAIESKIDLDRIINAKITPDEWIQLTNQAAKLADSVNFSPSLMKDLLHSIKP
jgi:hypothetical protein